MSLDAYFIGIIQVLVYAGASWCCFFLLSCCFDLRAEGLRKINWVASGGRIVVALVFPSKFSPLSAIQIGPAKFSRRLPKITIRRRTQYRPFTFRELQSAVQIIGVVVLVATIRRGRAEQTRAAIKWRHSGIISLSAACFLRSVLLCDVAAQHHHHLDGAGVDVNAANSRSSRFPDSMSIRRAAHPT